MNPDFFYSYAPELMPKNYDPSATHKFLARLDKNNQIRRIFTQNIGLLLFYFIFSLLDTLENKAGVDLEHIVYCHGYMFLSYVCLFCNVLIFLLKMYG
jgi:NAD-dependent SIR2 family protein deacetylase